MIDRKIPRAVSPFRQDISFVTFGLLVVSMVAGAINVSRINRFSSTAVLVFIGVELLRFFRAGDGVPGIKFKQLKNASLFLASAC